MSVSLVESYSYDDYKLWEGDWELIDGQPISMAPAPMIKHQTLAGKVITQLGNQLEECDKCEVLGEEDWVISSDTVLRPDVVVICDEPSDEHITKTPEIVVEIISASTAKKDETYKFEIYEKEATPYYILIYPDTNKAKLYKLKDGKFFKEGDFFKEIYKFEGLTCELELDFDRLFKKYREKY
jgi:Uma2 family endonuclease